MNNGARSSAVNPAPNGISPKLPQHGWFLDVEWVQGIHGAQENIKKSRKLKTFRENIRDSGIRHLLWRDTMIIHTSDFYGEVAMQPTENGFPPMLPQTGVFLDEEWAFAFGEEVETFRKKIRDDGVPHKKWGTKTMVSAEDLYASLAQKADQES